MIISTFGDAKNIEVIIKNKWIPVINNIVKELIENKEIERMLLNYSFHAVAELDCELKKDFTHDLILIILEYKDKKVIIDLYNKKQLGYFILKIIRNNILSNKSPYYQKYGKYQTRKVTFQDWNGGRTDRM